ncbi:hypothetical protein ACWGIV_19885 [Streptomyces sp. NPDC054844]
MDAGAFAAGLRRDPQVAGVAAFQVLGDAGADVEPAAQGLHGVLVEGVVEVGDGHDGDRATLQVDVGDVEFVELGHGAAGGGDEGGYRGGADGGGGVGAGGPTYGEGA